MIGKEGEGIRQSRHIAERHETAILPVNDHIGDAPGARAARVSGKPLQVDRCRRKSVREGNAKMSAAASASRSPPRTRGQADGYLLFNTGSRSYNG
jgi:hypothetical protein